MPADRTVEVLQRHTSGSTMTIAQSTIQVDDNGTKLAFTDSGTPSNLCEDYITIIATHGTGFSTAIFDKVAVLSHESGIRWVSVSRRNYPGSTVFTKAEKEAIKSAKTEDAETLLKAWGTQLATFYDLFVQKHNIPAISHDGKRGGVVVLGWSSGSTFALASMTQIESLSEDAQKRLRNRIRALILEDPLLHNLGFPVLPAQWWPFADPTIPDKERFALADHWIMSYYEHKSLTDRSFDSLTYAAPSPKRVPSIYNVPTELYAEDRTGSLVDNPFEPQCSPSVHAMVRKVLFGTERRVLFPKMDTWIIAGENTIGLSVACLWAVEDINRELGGGYIKSKFVPGGNHFMHWEDPEITFKVYMDCIQHVSTQ